MNKNERGRKLDWIAKLPADELRGWYREVIVNRTRPPFDGEVAAIMKRVERLELNVKGQ